MYVSKRLIIKDDSVNRTTLHSHYLFSDIAITTRNHLVASTDRFLTKFSFPEYDASRKVNK